LNYLKLYTDIINRANGRLKYNGTYYESHHILPKCIGGKNNKENLVNLTAREHFIAHWLLTKIYPNNKKIICAFNSFSWRINDKSTCEKGYNSKNYEYAKIKISKFLSEDKKWSEDCKQRAINTRWINNGNINKHIKFYLLEEYLEKGWILGRTKHNRKAPSKETKIKIGNSRKGKGHSNKTVELFKKYQKENPRKWMNNEQIESMINIRDIQNYLQNGWKMGRNNKSRFKNKEKING